jgi:hypothetical protein
LADRGAQRRALARPVKFADLNFFRISPMAA